MKFLSLIFLPLFLHADEVTYHDEDENIESFIKRVNQNLYSSAFFSVEVSWNDAIVNTVGSHRFKEIILNLEAQDLRNLKKQSRKYNTHELEVGPLRRQLKILQDYPSLYLLPNASFKRYYREIEVMKTNFDEVEIYNLNNHSECNVGKEPKLFEFFGDVRKKHELEFYWKTFYNNFGIAERAPFEDYVEFVNIAAKLNGRKSGVEFTFGEYENLLSKNTLESIMSIIRPLYLELHGYVRYRLRKFYGQSVSLDRPIEMHLLGNLWAENWANIFNIIAPYPKGELFDIKKKMIEKKLKGRDLHSTADDFFGSLGLKRLPRVFWIKSVLEEPVGDPEIICQPEVFDFIIFPDVRLKFCTLLNREHFRKIFNEFGHLQYFLQYKNQPFILQKPASPGFYEAIGDTIGLFALSPNHLERLGLIEDYVDNKTSRINYLFLTALEKLVYLPFAYSMEKFRWGVFRNPSKKRHWNCDFWKLRESYSGIEPPIRRFHQNFDPVAHYRIAEGKDYLSLVVGTILQFQLYEAACLKGDKYNDNNKLENLYDCRSFGDTEIGKRFENILSNGIKDPWTDVLYNFTGNRMLSAQPILNYFSPLHKWLKDENKRLGVKIGWEPSKKCRRVSGSGTIVNYKLLIFVCFDLILIL